MLKTSSEMTDQELIFRFKQLARNTPYVLNTPSQELDEYYEEIIILEKEIEKRMSYKIKNNTHTI